MDRTVYKSTTSTQPALISVTSCTGMVQKANFTLYRGTECIVPLYRGTEIISVLII